MGISLKLLVWLNKIIEAVRAMPAIVAGKKNTVQVVIGKAERSFHAGAYFFFDCLSLEGAVLDAVKGVAKTDEEKQFIVTQAISAGITAIHCGFPDVALECVGIARLAGVAIDEGDEFNLNMLAEVATVMKEHGWGDD